MLYCMLTINHIFKGPMMPIAHNQQGFSHHDILGQLCIMRCMSLDCPFSSVATAHVYQMSKACLQLLSRFPFEPGIFCFVGPGDVLNCWSTPCLPGGALLARAGSNLWPKRLQLQALRFSGQHRARGCSSASSLSSFSFL